MAEIGIGKKKIMDRSWGWWSREIEAAIQAQKVSCRKLREARSGNEVTNFITAIGGI